MEKISSKDYLNNLANLNQALQGENTELREELQSVADKLRSAEGQEQLQQVKKDITSLVKVINESIQLQESIGPDWDPSLIIGPRCSWMHSPQGVKCLINMGSAALFPIKVNSCKLETWFRDSPEEKKAHSSQVEIILQPGQQPDLIKTLRLEHEEIAGPRLNLRSLRDTYRELMYKLEVELAFSPRPGKDVISTGDKAAFGPADGWWSLLQLLSPYQFKIEGVAWQLAFMGQDLWDRGTSDWSTKAELTEAGGDQVYGVTYKMKGEVVRILRTQVTDPAKQAQKIWEAIKKCLPSAANLSQGQREFIIELRQQELFQAGPEGAATNSKTIRRSILQVLLRQDKAGSSAVKMDKQLSAELDLPLKVVQDQMEILESLGLVRMSKAFGPSYGAWITPMGRLHLEENAE